MLYTTYFANVKSLPPNTTAVSICGRSPDWWNGLEYKKFAPKWSFFSVWKETKDNDYYIKHFREEVLKQLDIIRTTTELQALLPYEVRGKMTEAVWNDENYHLALVCYEKPEDFCHRHLVSEWLNSAGFMCVEWRNQNKRQV